MFVPTCRIYCSGLLVPLRPGEDGNSTASGESSRGGELRGGGESNGGGEPRRGGESCCGGVSPELSALILLRLPLDDACDSSSSEASESLERFVTTGNPLSSYVSLTFTGFSGL